MNMSLLVDTSSLACYNTSMPELNFQIPTDYFKSVPRKEYANYRQALAREFLQNSNDAGASCVKFVLDTTERRLTVVDDGVGMDEEILVNKLLVLGGTHKAEGAVGGFGKAKELLFLAHKEFTIKTRNLVYKGSGLKGVLSYSDEHIQGTHIVVDFYEDENLVELKAGMLNQLRTNQPNCSVYFNGELVEPAQRGEYIKDLTVGENAEVFAKMYVNPDSTSYCASVRANGVQMFVVYLNSSDAPKITIELEGSSISKLTANRDYMNQDYAQALQAQINELVVDRLSATRPKPLQTTYLSGPNGPLRIQSSRTQNALKLADHSPHAVQDLVELLGSIGPGTDGSYYEKKRALMNTISRFSYQADFVLHQNKEIAAKMHPYSWNSYYRRLALTWEYTLKSIFNALDVDMVFSIGWIAEDAALGVQAEAAMHYDQDRGLYCFLLNPYASCVNKTKFRELVWEVLELAIHEIAHLKESYHDEVFVGECRKIRRAIRHIDFYKVCKFFLKEEEDKDE